MRRHLPALLLAASASLLTVDRLPAQDYGISIEPRYRGRIEAATTVTALFTVTNRKSDTVRLMPHVDAPRQWTVLTGTAAFLMPAASSEVLMLSVAVPARARAGVYPIRVALTTPVLFSLATDSILVVVPERRAVQLELLARPAYVVSPRTYDAVFLLRNRGNVRTTVRLAARSRLGTAELVGDPVALLEPDESREVRVRGRPPARLRSAEDDVLELSALALEDTAHDVHSSARITVVPLPAGTLDGFTRVPAQLRLRTAGASGVAPFEFVGAGPLRDGDDREIDFLVRGRGTAVAAFAERDEYRLEMRAPAWRVRLGDHLFAFSPLTNAGRAGFGAGTDLTRGVWSLGAYGQEFRREPGRDREVGATIGARALRGLQLGFDFVERFAGRDAIGIAGSRAAFQHGGERAEVDVVRSDGPRGTGMASSTRITGYHRHVAYDAGFLASDTSFAGTQPGVTNAYASASARPSRGLLLSINASSRATGTSRRDRLDLGSLSATLAERLTMELGAAARNHSPIDGSRATQHSLRLRGDQPFGILTFSLGVERGLAAGGTGSRGFGDLHAAVRARARVGSFAAFVTRQEGGSLTKGPEGAISAGGDASLQLGTTDAAIGFFTTRQRVLDAPWQARIDASLRHALRNGSALSMRLRLVESDAAVTERSAMFLEYSVPVRLPVSRLHTPGRVQGQIIDAASGHGVPNALVRLGTQVAVTDSKGQVAFVSVPAGEHRVSLAQEQSLADAVFIGDPTLRVDGSASRPLTFRLELARGAQLNVVVKRFAVARTAVDGAADSLTVAGPQANVTLRLVSQRDTVYGNTDADGRVSFIDVPPGRWTVAVHSEAPTHHRFEPDRMDVTLSPGETHALELRLVPRQRDVQIIGGEQELRPVPRERGQGNRERGNDKSGSRERE